MADYVEKNQENKKVDVWKLKKYVCKVKPVNIYTGKNIIVLNKDEAKEHDIYSGYRTELRHKGKSIIAIVDVSDELVKPGEVGVFKDLASDYRLKRGEKIEVVHMDRPESIKYIKKKLDKGVLNEKEIRTIVREIMQDRLSEIETSAWITAAYINGLSDDEVIALAHATVESGDSLKLGKHPVLDKHCLPEDVPVVVRNSSKVKVEPIGCIAQKIFERSGDSIKYEDGAEYVDENLNELQVLTYDDNGDQIFASVSRVYRVGSPKSLYELVLIGNRKIRATSNHTVFVLKKGKIVNIPISKIKQGDYVLVPGYMKSKSIGKIRFGAGYLDVNPELMRFLGYYISEGFTNYQGIFLNFGSHEKDLIRDASACIKKVFGRAPTVTRPHRTATRLCIYDRKASKIFTESIKAGSGALEKRIPHFVFDVTEDMKYEFVRALINGDGYVRRGYEAIYVTASKKLGFDLQYLLSLMGLSVSLSKGKPEKKSFMLSDGKKHLFDRKEAYYVYTQAREIFGGREKANVAFVNLLPIGELGEINKEGIGWEFRKRLKEQKYMTKKKLRRIVSDVESPDARKLILRNVSVLKVKKVEKVKSESEFVYDFTVPGYQRFAAGSAPMYVHNCIGGVAGNRTTMVMVPIIAAAGCYIPKTSSRSITSASGTADTMEVLADVTFNMEELRSIVLKAKGAMVWGGGMALAPVDDKLIRVRHPLSLDPQGMLLASILGKKKSVGAEYAIIDIPVGRGVKVPYVEKGNELANNFISIGEKLGIKIEALITDGAEPVGNGVGPALECIDVLEVLEGRGPDDLRHKSLLMAGKLLELCGRVKKGNGYTAAENLISSGKAMAKMREIIELQGGNPKVKVSDIAIGEYTHTFTADMPGSIFHIDNKVMAKVARIAGAPRDKGAGVLIHRLRGDRVEKGDKLFTIFSESESKLDFAIKALKTLEPVEMRKILLGTVR